MFFGRTLYVLREPPQYFKVQRPHHFELGLMFTFVKMFALSKGFPASWYTKTNSPAEYDGKNKEGSYKKY
jgi:hypothetical protein